METGFVPLSGSLKNHQEPGSVTALSLQFRFTSRFKNTTPLMKLWSTQMLSGFLCTNTRALESTFLKAGPTRALQFKKCLFA